MSQHLERKPRDEGCAADEQAEREWRLRRIKDRIRQGTYRPDIRDIAHHLVRMLEPTIL